MLTKAKWGDPTFGAPGGVVTFSFDAPGDGNQFTAEVTEEERNLFRMAFEVWDQLIDLDVREVASGGDISVGTRVIDGPFDNDTPEGRATALGFTDTVISTENELLSATIVMDDSEVWNYDPTYVPCRSLDCATIIPAISGPIITGIDEDNSYFKTALHEAGHALGLVSHFEQDGHVMSAASLVFEPTSLDISEIQSIYGPQPATGDTAVNREKNEGESTESNSISISVRGDITVFTGTQGPDRITGSDEDDVIRGRGSKDVLRGEAGDDTLRGGGGNDNLKGGLGNDALRGGGGNDRLAGQRGEDDIKGGGGGDRLIGGGGDDMLTGGRGTDFLRGGGGADVFVFRNGDGDDTITGFATGVDKIQLIRDEGDQAEIVVNDGNALVNYVGGSITLIGVPASDLTLDDFIF